MYVFSMLYDMYQPSQGASFPVLLHLFSRWRNEQSVSSLLEDNESSSEDSILSAGCFY